MIVQYEITSGAWLPITSAGQSGACWFDEQADSATGDMDVRIFHKSSAPGDSDFTKAKRVDGVMVFISADADDIYYAKCAPGCTAILSVDTGIGNQLVRLIQSSYSGDAIISTSYADDRIYQGKGFGIKYVFDVDDADGAYDILFDLSEITKKIVAYPITWNTSKGHGVVTIGICTEYTGGTAIIPTNRNSEYQVSNPSGAVFKYDITPTDYVATDTKLLIGTEATPIASGGGTGEELLPQWLPAAKIVFRFSNLASDDIKLGMKIVWFEVG